MQRREVVRAFADERCERGSVDWTAVPPADVDVDHAASLAPSFVDVAVAVEQPLALIDGPLLDEPVVIVTVASIREVARKYLSAADTDVRVTQAIS